MYGKNRKYSGIARFVRYMAAAVMMLVFCFLLPVGNAGVVPGTVTAEAASTSVKSLAVGKSYTVSGYAKMKSSKTSIATTKKKSSKKYKVTAKKKGVTTLKCYNSSGKLVKKIYLVVTNSSSFQYDTTGIVLKEGNSVTVKATVQNGCTVKYSSANKNVATVNSKGEITAKGCGTTTISAKVYYKGKKIKTMKKSVFVKDTSSSSSGSGSGSGSSSSDSDEIPALTVSFDSSDVTISPGKTVTAKATVTSGYTVKYSSSNTDAVTVDNDGTVTAIGNGKSAYIYVKIYYGNTLKRTLTKKIVIRQYSISSYGMNPYVEKEQTVVCGCGSDYSYEADDVFLWETSDASIVSITSSGNSCMLKAIAVGSATVTCKVNGILCYTLQLSPRYSESQRLRMVQTTEYDYEVYLVGVDKVFSGKSICLYIKTDNPDYSKVALGLERYGGNFLPYKMADIEYTEYRTPTSIPGTGSSVTNYMKICGGFSTVPGGYLATLSFSGDDNTLYVYEIDSDDQANCALKIDVNVIDSSVSRADWIQWLVDNCTTSDMDSFEKLDAVCDYLRQESGFTYLHNMDDQLINLSTDCSPCYYRKTWDSAESPSILAEIAEAIGGFDLINNCYDDYEYGSAEWSSMHFLVEVGIGDDVRYYFVCPSSSTGNLESINYIDFSSTAQLTKIEGMDNTINWNDIYPTPTINTASETGISAASLDDDEAEMTEAQETESDTSLNGEDIESAEVYEIEIALFDDDQATQETDIIPFADESTGEEIIVENSDDGAIIEEEIAAAE